MTYKIDIFDDNAKKTKTLELDKAIFNDEFINDTLVHEFILMQQANQRQVSAHTKTRGEVAGSGRKLFKQKSTGNARAGDARSPVRRHGGVAFGPRNDRNFTKKMPKKMRVAALKSALTMKAKALSVFGLEGYSPDTIKTKNAVSLFNAIQPTQKKLLLVIPEKNHNIVKSINNIPYISYTLVDYVSPYDILTHHSVFFMTESLDKLSQMLKDTK